MSGTIWTKFYWSDWETDHALKLCSFAAQGLWMRMLCIASAHDPIGYVAVAGRALDETAIARMTGGQESEVRDLLGELERNGVFSRDRQGRIYSRRMVADARKAAIARKNGKNGGNPNLGNHKENPASVNPQDKARVKAQKPEAREDRMSNDILVGSGDPTPVGDDLFGGDQGKPAKPRLVPTKAELDAIWEITPPLGRERSSRKDLERALTAAMRRGHEPAAVLAGIRAAYASKSYSGDSAKGVHRLIEADRWQTFVELARPASAAPVATWRGPRQVRDAVVAHAGEDFARGWLDAATWRPAPDRAVLARNSFIASRLEREVGPMLRAMGVSIEVAQGVAA